MSLLGDALLGQQKYTAAEKLLLDGYDGMKRREETIVAPVKYRLTNAIERLVRFYEATDQPENARLWRDRLPAIPSSGGLWPTHLR